MSSSATPIDRETEPLRSATIAVVGATGAAGGTVLRLLAERGVAGDRLRLLASERSVGRSLRFSDGDLTVQLATESALSGCDLVFLAAGSGTARRLAPVVAAAGGLAVDKSSAYRADPAVPLIVPSVNGAELTADDRIIANPNCIAIPLTMVLAPLIREFGVIHITCATYQAASGGGNALAGELHEQLRADAAGETPAPSVYPHVLHGNVVPGGWSMEGDDTEEELKVIAETRRVLALPELPVSITTVRVPVAIGHSVALWFEGRRDIDPVVARTLLGATPGLRVVDDPTTQSYPTPRDASGQDDVLVGRIRRDRGRPGALALFFSADNLRRGAATNAVEAAELALRLRR